MNQSFLLFLVALLVAMWTSMRYGYTKGYNHGVQHTYDKLTGYRLPSHKTPVDADEHKVSPVAKEHE